MSILKKLIFKEWFRFFISSVVILFMLISVTDLVVGFLRDNLNAYEVIISYLLKVPDSLQKIFPVSCLIASLFSINKLINRNELTALFSIGYSRRQFITTVLQASLVVMVAQFVTSAYLKPFVKKNRHNLLKGSVIKFRNLKSQGLRASTIGSGKIWYKSGDYFFSFAKFDKSDDTLHDVTLYYFNDKYQLTTNLKAKIARYKSNNIWSFQQGMIYEKLDTLDFPRISPATNLLRRLNETPDDFKQIEADITTLFFPELYTYISKLSSSGINTNEYLVLLLDSISSSLICVILTIVAATSAFNPNRRSSSFAKNLIFVFVFTILYWLVYSYTIQLGINSRLHPILACFSVPFMFIIYLIYFFFHHRKLR